MGVLSSLLSGAAFGTELGSMEEGPKPGQDGHFVAAIHIGAFEEVGRFKERMDRIVRQLRACRLAPGFERVYAPGEKEHLNRQAYPQEGIPLTVQTLEGLFSTAAELGLAAAAYRFIQ